MTPKKTTTTYDRWIKATVDKFGRFPKDEIELAIKLAEARLEKAEAQLAALRTIKAMLDIMQ